LASRAAQLAQFLNMRAKEEESPFLRKELEEKAALLDTKSNELIAAVNDLLEDPDNKDHAKRVNDLLQELNDLVSKSARAVKEGQIDQAPVDENSLASVSKALEAREAARKGTFFN